MVNVNRYCVRVMGFYGEVEITCQPEKLNDGAGLRTRMVDEAMRAYGELKKVRGIK